MEESKANIAHDLAQGMEPSYIDSNKLEVNITRPNGNKTDRTWRKFFQGEWRTIPSSSPVVDTSILRTNRLIYTESLQVLYTSKIFAITLAGLPFTKSEISFHLPGDVNPSRIPNFRVEIQIPDPEHTPEPTIDSNDWSLTPLMTGLQNL
ncbi:hypothetical protein BCR34DRAFT_606813 [Clohesyomyces aquaticus]|uniref:Uncharacterized protein n=1 Tax=Clohesyomyces aquaticus TaxID=1231657 RepID=A0A1Y1YLV7_9PLEO|nr:hypothetical protein BCR34DRAFT_606813 [Clohesyomyces aquaticus]